MEFQSLYALRRYLEITPVERMWRSRFSGHHTIFIEAGMIEITMCRHRYCLIDYTTKAEPDRTIDSRVSSNGFDMMSSFLDQLFYQVNAGADDGHSHSLQSRA